jgi:hypothetical protein
MRAIKQDERDSKRDFQPRANAKAGVRQFDEIAVFKRGTKRPLWGTASEWEKDHSLLD